MANQFEFDFKTIEKPKTFEDIVNAKLKVSETIGYSEINDLFQEYLRICPAKVKQDINIRYEEFKEELREINDRANLGIDNRYLSNDDNYLKLTRQFNEIGENEEIFSSYTEAKETENLPTSGPSAIGKLQLEKNGRYDKVKTHVSEIERVLKEKENE